jgi:hypothetical protein
MAAGNWGYVVFQCAAAAFAFAFLSGIVLKRNHPYALVVSLLVSGAGIFAGWILADIWTLIGLICLFAISAGYAFPAIALLLSFSCSTHFGNFPRYSAAALLVLPLVREKAKFAVRTCLCLIAAIVFVVAANLVGGVLKLSSGIGRPRSLWVGLLRVGFNAGVFSQRYGCLSEIMARRREAAWQLLPI